MNAPTYDIRHAEPQPEQYLEVVRQLTDWLLNSGSTLQSVTSAYAEFVELNGREATRSHEEYLLEALTLGVLWRARGREALSADGRRAGLVTELLRERRAGGGKRRDGSSVALVELDGPAKRGRIDPTLQEISQLLDWLLATGEYDDEHARLEGWKALLATTQPATNREILRLIVAFAVAFEAKAERLLGRFTLGVDRFLSQDLRLRAPSEDVVQCSRRRVEYHLNMVGADLLNRAWRSQFLACRRHVIVVPGCARQRGSDDCRAVRIGQTSQCSHCTLGCAVSAATRLAERTGSEAITVMHNSDFSRFLDDPILAGRDVGIVGIACASGLIGAGWRARGRGFPAQCVLLNSSGCNHWASDARPTSFDLTELARILASPERAVGSVAAPRVA